jgi:hypothetical protein
MKPNNKDSSLLALLRKKKVVDKNTLRGSVDKVVEENKTFLSTIIKRSSN